VEKLFGMRMAGLCQFYWRTCLCLCLHDMASPRLMSSKKELSGVNGSRERARVGSLERLIGIENRRKMIALACLYNSNSQLLVSQLLRISGLIMNVHISRPCLVINKIWTLVLLAAQSYDRQTGTAFWTQHVALSVSVGAIGSQCHCHPDLGTAFP